MTTILLVDDDPTLRQLYTDLLEELGFAVFTAPDGQVALHLALRLRPDLIITDLMMPRMNGLELCQRLREDERLRYIPRIIQSSEDHVTVPAGEVFLRKNGDLTEIVTQVAHCLGLGYGETPLGSAA
jgi:CheY-like chemotaxis protein